MERGNKVVEIATGRVATIVFTYPNGTDSHAEPWAKIMFALTKEEGYGVSFCCRDLSELRSQE